MSFPERFLRRRRRAIDEPLPEARSPYDDYIPGQDEGLQTLEWRPGQLTGRQRWEQSIGRGVIDRTPGFAGGTMGDQLRRDQVPSGDVHPGIGVALQSQQEQMRPRRVNPFQRSAPIPEQEGFGESGEPFGSTRPRRTQPRDYIADDEAYLRDLQKQPRTWKDKTVDVIRAVSEGFGNKPSSSMTARERELAQTQGRLKTGLDTQRIQAQTEAARQRPQYQQASLDEREINNALNHYNRLEHYDPDDPANAALRKYFESRGFNLPKKDKYRRPIVTRTDDGRIIVTGPDGSQDMQVEGEVVTDSARTPTPVVVGDREFNVPQKQAAQITAQTSTAAANRAAADTRSRRAQEGQDRRLDKRLAAPSRTTGGGSRGPDRAAQRKAAQLIGTIERARKEMEFAVAKGDAEKRAQAQLIGEQAAAELNALGAGYEAGPGEKGYPYYKQGGQKSGGGQYSGRRISKANVAEYGRRHGMSAEQAAQFLSGEGAVIY